MVPPLILTVESAPADRRAALAEAGGEVVVLPRLTPDVLLAELARRGLTRVLCEGGPSLLGDAAGRRRRGRAVPDGGAAAGRRRGRAGSRTARPGPPPRRMTLVGALHADDALLLRYRRSADPTDAADAPPPV